jgi:hypothetical protein
MKDFNLRWHGVCKINKSDFSQTTSLQGQQDATQGNGSPMKELLYFSFADLMVRVEYHQEANSLRYSTHRNMTFGERVIVEQYLLTTTALKTEYYRRQPALFIYLGTDAQLIKELDSFHLKNTLKDLIEKEKDIKASVSDLISQSMQSYYFEQIGDTILDIRREVENDDRDRSGARLHLLRMKMEELVKAYNLYSEQKITMEEIIPTELKSHFGITVSPDYVQTIMTVHDRQGRANLTDEKRR